MGIGGERKAEGNAVPAKAEFHPPYKCAKITRHGRGQCFGDIFGVLAGASRVSSTLHAGCSERLTGAPKFPVKKYVGNKLCIS